jgi:hypothetical protein
VNGGAHAAKACACRTAALGHGGSICSRNVIGEATTAARDPPLGADWRLVADRALAAQSKRFCCLSATAEELAHQQLSRSDLHGDRRGRSALSAVEALGAAGGGPEAIEPR